MKQSTKILIGVVIGFGLIIGGTVGYIISAKFTAAGFENSINFADKNNQNVHSAMNKILTTSGLTVKNFGKTKIDAIKAKIAQYADKPEMMMMWVKENPQNIDSKVWEKFQHQAEVQYTNFQKAQEDKLSRAQAYDDFLKASVKGFVATTFFNYPTPATRKKMDLVIQTAETKETWDTGIDKPVNVL